MGYGKVAINTEYNVDLDMRYHLHQRIFPQKIKTKNFFVKKKKQITFQMSHTMKCLKP